VCGAVRAGAYVGLNGTAGLAAGPATASRRRQRGRRVFTPLRAGPVAVGREGEESEPGAAPVAVAVGGALFLKGGARRSGAGRDLARRAAGQEAAVEGPCTARRAIAGVGEEGRQVGPLGRAGLRQRAARERHAHETNQQEDATGANHG
jgi:hypothetical protein